MDLAKLDVQDRAEAGATMTVMHPASGEPLVDDKGSMTIRLAGEDSRDYRKGVRSSRLRRLELLENKESDPDKEFDSIEQDRIEVLARCTRAWTNVWFDGEELECTYENAVAVYSRPGLHWLVRQVDSFVNNISNYLGN